MSQFNHAAPVTLASCLLACRFFLDSCLLRPTLSTDVISYKSLPRTPNLGHPCPLLLSYLCPWLDEHPLIPQVLFIFLTMINICFCLLEHQLYKNSNLPEVCLPHGEPGWMKQNKITENVAFLKHFIWKWFKVYRRIAKSAQRVQTYPSQRDINILPPCCLWEWLIANNDCSQWQ